VVTFIEHPSLANGFLARDRSRLDWCGVTDEIRHTNPLPRDADAAAMQGRDPDTGWNRQQRNARARKESSPWMN
jgi:hypothetical protein